MAISLVQDDSVQVTCVDQSCEFRTEMCSSIEGALGILKLHMEYMHPEPTRADKGIHSIRIVVPELLDLDPSENCFEEYQFWAQRFTTYLLDCEANDPEVKYRKLVSLLSFRTYQHLTDCLDFDTMMGALAKLYTKPHYIFASRNKLMGCRQSSSENVQQYLHPKSWRNS